jgi:hypothetical protein
MKAIILLILLAETNGIRLRGIYQQQREKVIESTVSNYFLKIYTDTVLTASLSDKYTNYSFYEYGCIPIEKGMVNKRYISYNMNECDVHTENINYYSMVNYFIEDGIGNVYQKRINNVLNEDLKHYHVEYSEIMNRTLKKINETFSNIEIKKTKHKCCNEYTIYW